MLFFMRVKLKNEKLFITLFLSNLQLFQHGTKQNLNSSRASVYLYCLY